MMTLTEQKTAARDFAAFWTGKGYEKGQPQFVSDGEWEDNPCN